MRHLLSSLLIAAGGCLSIAIPAAAAPGTVYVKYRGSVSLEPFVCEWVERSSVVKRLCYDAKEKYVIVNLTGTYYHYCEVPAAVVSSWRAAESMGHFYNASVKGNFDCRVYKVPPYSSKTTTARASRPFRSGDCESGHWVESVTDDGEIVKLEDGSIWQVDAGDTVDSALWLPTTDIVACDDKLINTEDNETVSATRLR